MRLSSHDGGGGWPGGVGGLPPGPLGRPPGNHFGDGSDGAGVIATSTSLASVQDGDMVVRQYTNLTINAGATLTVASRCRGLLLYVDGDLTVNGVISMTARGCAANPLDAVATADTPVAPSDGHGVPVGGIVLRRKKAGATDFNSDTNLFHGCGVAAVAAEAWQGGVLGNGKVWTLPVVGGAGGAGFVTGWGGSDTGRTGGSRALSPGGGASADTYCYGTQRGGNATCFSGGVGAGASSYDLSALSDYGGKGGDAANNGGGTSADAGTGNPGGAPYGGATYSGTGGVLILIVRGKVTIGASGSIISAGVGANGTLVGIPGGPSGGGNILLLHGGGYSNSGSITAPGGVGSNGSAWGCGTPYGGVGSVTVDSIDNR